MSCHRAALRAESRSPTLFRSPVRCSQLSHASTAQVPMVARGTVGGKAALDIPFQTLTGPSCSQDKNMFSPLACTHSLSSVQLSSSEKGSFLTLSSLENSWGQGRLTSAHWPGALYTADKRSTWGNR